MIKRQREEKRSSKIRPKTRTRARWSRNDVVRPFSVRGGEERVPRRNPLGRRHGVVRNRARGKTDFPREHYHFSWRGLRRCGDYRFEPPPRQVIKSRDPGPRFFLFSTACASFPPDLLAPVFRRGNAANESKFSPANRFLHRFPSRRSYESLPHAAGQIVCRDES